MQEQYPLKNELATIRLPVGTSKEIDKVLKGGELRAVFMREAVLSELRRRRSDAARAPVKQFGE